MLKHLLTNWNGFLRKSKTVSPYAARQVAAQNSYSEEIPGLKEIIHSHPEQYRENRLKAEPDRPARSWMLDRGALSIGRMPSIWPR